MSTSPPFRKVFISLDNIPDEALTELQDHFHLIDEQDPYAIWQLWRSKNLDGSTNDFTLQNIYTLETFLFINYLKRQGIEDIEVLNDQQLFLLNDDLYRIVGDEVIKEDLTNIGFLSVRATNWNYPFFSLLETLVDAHGGVLNKTNRIPKKPVFFKGKFYALNSLYPLREELIGDIVVPYKVTSHAVFLDFLRHKLGDRLILKRDNTQVGQGVIPVDASYPEAYDKFSKEMRSHVAFLHEIYIVPYYQFKIEYRVYFTKFDNEIELYSMKHKKVSARYGDIFTKKNFEYYTNVHLDWEYIPRHQWPEEVVALARKYIDNLHYNTGSLEFGFTEDHRLIFFEVNAMSDPVAFRGDDIKDMQRYYEDIFHKIMNGQS